MTDEQPKLTRRKYHEPGWTPAPAKNKNYNTLMKPDTHAKMQKLARLLGMYQIEVLAQAVDRMVESLPQEQRDLYEALPD